jgi:RNA polymerase sigma factor (sigma-70 family)
VEASALQAPATLTEAKVGMAMPLLRFRSDDQLVALFRAGHDDAFQAIHDRYHKRLFAYARQMLPARQDAEDALQDVFVRAYSGLRASDRELALRAWLFRVAHNRCVDELRRPAPPPPEVLQLVRCTAPDPLVEVDRRESLRRLIADIRRLPDQQRSALLMRELGGMSYSDLAISLGISTAAVKSLLVRARISLAQAADARDTACVVIREELVDAHDRGVRPNANARKHMRDCVGCKSFRRELRGVTRQLAATTPAIGPLGFLAKVLGFSGGAGGGAAGGGAVLLSGGATASAGGLGLGASHVATLLVAAVATAGGAVEIQHTIIAQAHRPAHTRSAPRGTGRSVSPFNQAVTATAQTEASGIQAVAQVAQETASIAPQATVLPGGAAAGALKPKHRAATGPGAAGIGPDAASGSSTGAATLPTTTLNGAGASGATSATGSLACGPGTPSATTPAASDGSTGGSPGTTSSTSSSPGGSSSSTTTSCGGATPSSNTASSSSSTPSSSPAASSSGTTSSSSTGASGLGSGTTPSSSGGAGTPSGGSSAPSK